jgi:hypothetical protein
MRNQSGGSSVEVINIGEKRPFQMLKTVVNAAQNALDSLLFGIIFYFDLRRSGIHGIGTLNELYIHLLRFTGKASGTQHLECATSKLAPTAHRSTEIVSGPLLKKVIARYRSVTSTLLSGLDARTPIAASADFLDSQK